jgi:tetratricopeptide (TPR) repeat protein
MAGLATLFTRDFFALAEDRLNENGVFVQCVHVYQMDWPTFALVGRAFRQVFPNSFLVSTYPSGIVNVFLLVGFKDKSKLALESAQQKLSYARQSKNMTLADPRLLCRLIVSEDLRGLFGRGPVNTDSWPRLEFAAPKLMHMNDPMIERNILSKKRLSPGTTRIVRQVTTDVGSQIDFAAYALSVHEPFRNMVDLSKATPSQKERFFKLMETYCANNSIDYSIFKDDVLKQRCQSIQIEVIEDKIDSMPDKALSYFYLGVLYYEEGMLDEAMASYFNSLQIKPDSAKTHYNLGLTYSRQGKLDEAVVHFTEALRINPFLAQAHSNIGGVLIRQGKLNEAITHYIKALRVKPDLVNAHFNLGLALSQQGKFDEAIRHFSEVLRIKPNNAKAHMSLGMAFAQQDKLDEAIRHFSEAVRIKPLFVEAHHNLGAMLAQWGRFDEAIKHFSEALRINPNFTAAQESLERVLLMKKSKDKVQTEVGENLKRRN